jgi:hypothetical protein
LKEVDTVNRRLCFLVLLFLPGALGLLPGRDVEGRGDSAPAASPAPLTRRSVILAGGLSDEQVLVVSAGLAAAENPPILLLDSMRLRRYVRLFLDAYHADQVVPVGTFAEGPERLQGQLGTPVKAPVDWPQGRPDGLWKLLFPRATDVVVCPAEPRAVLLQSACLAGALRAPLYVLHGQGEEATDLRRRLTAWGTRRVYAAGGAAGSCRDLPDVNVVPLADEQAVASAYQERLAKKGPIETLVVLNPNDSERGRPATSTLGPWVALRRRAALVLSDERGNPTAALAAARLNSRLRQADYLILAADQRAIPMERRPNPLPTAEKETPLEPPYPGPDQPFTYGTGRLFHHDLSVVSLTVAREELLKDVKEPRKVLYAANAGGVLPLLETISRNTANEFRNAGYQTTLLTGGQPNQQNLHQLLPQNDIFVWEGHHMMIMAGLGPQGNQPLRPSLIFLQSCVALQEANAMPLLERGAVAVIAPGSYTFSASGGAFCMAYFDAMFYDGKTLGGALREAKNFMLAYAQLKDKRLGQPHPKSGANVRSAWAFTLWGDPTLKLPAPPPPKDHHTPVRTTVKGNSIVVTLPPEKYAKVTPPRGPRSGPYEAVIWPNGRLAGLMHKMPRGQTKPLLPMIFAEVHLPQGAGQGEPRLSTRLPGDHWVFLWDERRLTGYLLIRPRTRDREEIRFHVNWED